VAAGHVEGGDRAPTRPHQATVRKLVNAATADEVVAKSLQRAHIVDSYIEHLHRRWDEGTRNATELYREIKQLGYEGGELAVQRHLRRYRTGRGHAPVPRPNRPRSARSPPGSRPTRTASRRKTRTS